MKPAAPASQRVADAPRPWIVRLTHSHKRAATKKTPSPSGMGGGKNAGLSIFYAA